MREQRQRQRGQKVFSLHAPEVECIGKGKAHSHTSLASRSVSQRPSSAARAASSSHTSRLGLALHNDGHTLEKVLPEIESQIGVNLTRIVADAGYKGHNAPEKHKLKIFTSGQKRGVTDSIKKALRRRAAVEPVIGHLKAEHRMAEITSPDVAATLSMPSSPPPVTTSACS